MCLTSPVCFVCCAQRSKSHDLSTAAKELLHLNKELHLPTIELHLSEDSSLLTIFALNVKRDFFKLSEPERGSVCTLV